MIFPTVFSFVGISSISNTCTENENVEGYVDSLPISIQEVALPIFDKINQSYWSPHIAACMGGIFFANGLNNLVKPKASGIYMLGNFALSALLGAYAYNKDDTNLMAIFLGSALATAIQRIKSLENQQINFTNDLKEDSYTTADVE